MGIRSYIKKNVWSMANQIQHDLEGDQGDSWSEFLTMQIIQQMSGTLTVSYDYYIPLSPYPTLHGLVLSSQADSELPIHLLLNDNLV